MHASRRPLSCHGATRGPGCRLFAILIVQNTDIYYRKAAVIRRWSAAPELEAAIEFDRYLRFKGVLSALAHTDAVCDEVIVAF